MTIDEMINKLNAEREQQEDTIKYLKYHKEDEHYITPHKEAISDCEQLAEWLEELKAIRQWKADVMESFCKYDVSSFEELIDNARAKAIDEFAERLHNLCGFEIEDYQYPYLLDESRIDEIAKQLKASGKHNNKCYATTCDHNNIDYTCMFGNASERKCCVKAGV